ncbi:Phosphoenolpyruvate carboxylase 2 [Clarias magur]|uniref:Phosphoenolpyruvate carboxylase 2 n=1 Tax=Clarias magur TaxID=1594786 RepID=A0A8J4WR19_CLAMG|nr:Phosphoenolpyruvate carboxylase 2 [Clarias magur]
MNGEEGAHTASTSASRMDQGFLDFLQQQCELDQSIISTFVNEKVADLGAKYSNCNYLFCTINHSFLLILH